MTPGTKMILGTKQHCKPSDIGNHDNMEHDTATDDTWESIVSAKYTKYTSHQVPFPYREQSITRDTASSLPSLFYSGLILGLLFVSD